MKLLLCIGLYNTLSKDINEIEPNDICTIILFICTTVEVVDNPEIQNNWFVVHNWLSVPSNFSSQFYLPGPNIKKVHIVKGFFSSHIWI